MTKSANVNSKNRTPLQSTSPDPLNPVTAHPMQPILLGSNFQNAGRPDERLDSFFEQLVDDHGSKVAVISQGRPWTYKEMNKRANQFARFLIDLGVLPGDRVALILDRSIDTYVAMLAIAKAGAAYVPLATAFPADRMAMIIDDAKIGLVVTLSTYAERAEELPVPFITMDTSTAEISSKSGAALKIKKSKKTVSDDTCYILYTSGTTGKPKGVVIRHQSLCNFIRVAAASYGYEPGDRVYQGMTIAFDFSTEEIWVPFAAGATVVPAPGPLTLVGAELAEFLLSNKITGMACSPTLLSTIEVDIPSLRLLLVGGEACSHNLVVRWAKPGRKILNTYGPTEATVTATMCELTADKPVTIGAPLPTYSIVILDPEKPELSPPDELGEIGIAGIGLAVGYLNREDLTEQKFIADFVGLPNNPSKRIYRTGDLGRINANGEIEYHGRIDTQVKIRGYRIELEEIEAILLEQPSISQAVVTTYSPTPDRVELVGYYAVKSGFPPLAKADIAVELKRRLPDYMVPSYLEELPALPMTVSDKVDIRRLPQPTSNRLGTDRTGLAPRNDDEQFLTDTLVDILGSSNVYVEDHFFNDLGANSLLMARFCTRLRTRKEWAKTSMRDIYLFPTIASLVEHLRGPEEEQMLADQPILVSKATDFMYWMTGLAQLIFYGIYSYVGLVILNYDLNWIYDKLDDPLSLYIRCVVVSVVVFFGMSGFAILAKWALIGRWKQESFPIWSLRYFRFWVVKSLIRTAPVVLFRGSPLYTLYLRLLGAKLGRNTVVECRFVPVCTDMISIGDNTIIRKESVLLGYHAQAGYIHIGPVTIGRDSFVGVGSTVDINTQMGDRSQLGHSSTLMSGQVIPKDEHYHGSPAVRTTANYCPVETRQLSRLRHVLFEIYQLVALFAFVTPLPFVLQSYWENVGDDYQETIGLVLVAATFVLGGYIGFNLLTATMFPRIFRLFLKPGKVYRLYGFHYWLQTVIEISCNSRTLNILFGDSSAIVHYIRAIGWNLNKVVQTGSNFGTNTQQDNPLFCEIGSRTMVSDGIFMINMQKSASSFRLDYTKVGEDNYFGNNIYYPPDSRTGNNCLLGTKVMVPIEGPIRENVGLLGSPPFEIPRMVQRDKDLIQGVSESDRQARLPYKNWHNAVTGLIFLAIQWTVLFVTIAIWDRALNYYTEWGGLGLFIASLITSAILFPFYILMERASLGFRKLQPLTTTIYDVAFWNHERHWKISDSPLLMLFTGTPFRPMILRMLGTKVGKRVYDCGANLTERSLVEIGDDCTLNEGCVIQAHSLEEGAFKSDYIRIGNGCTLAPAAFVHYGVTMEDGSIADTDSFVMKGETLEANSVWQANPAKLHRFVVPMTN